MNQVSTWQLVTRQWDYWKTVYLRTFRGSFASNFFSPLFNVVALGVMLGGFVKADPATLSGAPSYLAFVVPGLLASTAMMTAFEEASYPVVGALKWERSYFAMQATPLTPVAILWGHLLYITARLVMVSVVFVAVMVPFGVFATWWSPIAAIGASTLIGLTFTTPMYAFSVHVGTETWFNLFWRLGVMPLFLFSGAFFPITNLSPSIRRLAQVLPLSHGVDLTRMLALNHVDLGTLAAQVTYLVVVSALGYVLSVRALTRRLASG